MNDKNPLNLTNLCSLGVVPYKISGALSHGSTKSVHGLIFNLRIDHDFPGDLSYVGVINGLLDTAFVDETFALNLSLVPAAKVEGSCHPDLGIVAGTILPV